MKLSCPIVEDLLPFYHDNTCSKESRKIIEDHLAGCPACRSVLGDLQEVIPYVGKTNGEKVLQSVEKMEKKKKKYDLLNVGGISVLLAVLALLFWCVQVSVWFPISASKFEIRDLCQLSNGDVYFRIWSEDLENLDTLFFHSEEDDSFYLTFMRHLIQDPGEIPEWLTVEERQNGMIRIISPDEYSALYVGPVGRGQLVWKEGQELPPATEEIEKSAINFYRYYGMES
ncbi:zf-HC2 domain-containing protein [Evtepia sp.]|uniref:zf-HC2 domain-containing protein n=1 Tax=Evtepia sp. TaxID=2773933 RepID=UPI003F16E605